MTLSRAAHDVALRYQRGELELEDDALDEALGLAPAARNGSCSSDPALEAQFPGESLVHVATPYARCRAFFDAVRPADGDVVVDLGCGTGRLVVYGALVYPARWVGIELVASRAAIARRWVERLALTRVEIVVGNALDSPLEQGTVFYLFRPFSPETEAAVLTKLHALGRRRAITVGAYRLQPGLFDARAFEATDRGDLRIYRSRAAGAARRRSSHAITRS